MKTKLTINIQQEAKRLLSEIMAIYECGMPICAAYSVADRKVANGVATFLKESFAAANIYSLIVEVTHKSYNSTIEELSYITVMDDEENRIPVDRVIH